MVALRCGFASYVLDHGWISIVILTTLRPLADVAVRAPLAGAHLGAPTGGIRLQRPLPWEAPPITGVSPGGGTSIMVRSASALTDLSETGPL